MTKYDKIRQQHVTLNDRERYDIPENSYLVLNKCSFFDIITMVIS